MIYTGSNEILGIKLGDTDISAIYAGDLLIYPTTVTAWSVTPAQIEMASTGGTERIKIAALSAWTITSSESWITFSQNSGDSGRTTVIATVSANDSVSRTATITVSDGDQFSQTISVSQEGLAFSVSPSSIEVLSAATTQEITISSPYPWTIVSSESWITFSQDSGDNGTYTVVASIDMTTSERTAAITVDNGYEYSAISVTQSVCNPIVCADHLGNRNNQGFTSGSNTYLFDSGITEISSCYFDFTGIKQFSHRNWESVYPSAAVGTFNNTTNATGCINTLETFEAYMPDVETINYAFGNDRETNVSQTLTSVTITGTHKLTKLYGFVYYNRNIKKVVLDDLSHLSTFGNGANPVFNASNSALTDFEVTALPNMNMESTVGFNNLTALTVESLVNIFNALPVANGSRTIAIGSINKNKLSAAQLAIATNKGWTVN